MKNTHKQWLAAIGSTVVVIGYSLPGLAHHAFATEFDASKPLVIEGTVTKIRWVNPHSWIYIDVKNPDGTVTNWGLEFGAPLRLQTVGITRDQVAIGTQLRLAGFRAKNGGPFGYAATVAFPDGRQVSIGGAPDAPTPVLR